MEAFCLDGVEIIVDGSHNGDSVKLFLEGLRHRFPQSSICVAFGGGAEKCLDNMLVELFQNSDDVVLVQSKHFKAIGEHFL